MRYYGLINQFPLMIVMMFFLFICLCAALTAAVVFILKKNNERHRQQLADHEQHLPVLTVDLNTLALESEDTNEELTEAVEAPPLAEASAHWKDQVRSLRDAGSYAQAILAANTAWPQWQYYEQVAIIIRAAIREHKKSAPAQIEHWLEKLYDTAAEASLVHDSPQLPSSREQVSGIKLPYADVGVDKLRLLTKTDKKQMHELWGAPKQHISANEWVHQQN